MSSPSRPTLEGPALLELLEAAARGADALVLAGGVSHEMSNALQALVLARSMTEGPGPDDAVRQSLDKVVEQLTIAVTALREVSRPAQHDVRPAIVRELLETVDRWQRYQKLLPRVPVQFDVAPDLPAVRADERRIRHALLALLTNAKEAMDDVRGTIIVSATLVEGGVAIAVEDEGEGFAPGLGERAFEPFVTTKNEQLHRGLGLTVARVAVEASGGSLRIDSAGRGARLVARLQEWQRSAKA